MMWKPLVISVAVLGLCPSVLAQATPTLEESAGLAVLSMPQASKALNAIRPEMLGVEYSLGKALAASLDRAKRRIEHIRGFGGRVAEKPTLADVYYLMESMDSLEYELEQIDRLLMTVRAASGDSDEKILQLIKPIVDTKVSLGKAAGFLDEEVAKFIEDADKRLQRCEARVKPDGGV